MTRVKIAAAWIVVLLGLAAGERALERKAQAQPSPLRFEVDPLWPKMQHLFLADAGNAKVHIYDRRTLQEIGGFGRIGHYAGQFVFLHNVSVDSRGNVYTSEVGTGRRVQKFVRLATR